MKLELTDDEVLLLSSSPREEIQKAVGLARARIEMAKSRPELSIEEARFLADVLDEAKTRGVLVLEAGTMFSCPLCKKRGEDILYRSGTRKGKRKSMGVVHGIELANRFVRVGNNVTLGACHECLSKESLLTRLRDELKVVPVQLPAHLYVAGASNWRKIFHVRCESCGWEGLETEMRRLRSLTGSGSFFGGCLKCSAENRWFGQTLIHRLATWVMVQA